MATKEKPLNIRLEQFFQLYASLPFDDAAAAIALAHDRVLVTHNTREFSRIAGLRLEDWEHDDAAS